MTKKKIVIILIILALLATAGFAVYYFYFRKPGAMVVIKEEGLVKSPSQIGVAAINDKLKRISSAAAVSPVASSDGAKVMYVGKTGGIYEVDFDGGNAKTSDFIVLQNLTKILWSQNKEGFAAVYANADGKKTFYYNTKTKEASPYDNSIKSLAFSKTDDKIAYYSSNDLQNTNAVFSADPNGSSAKNIFNTRIRDIRLEWVSGNQIAITTAPSGLAPNLLWVLNSDTQKFLPVLSQVYGFTMKWAPGGERFIFSQTNSKGANLSLFSSNQTGTEVKDLGVATLPEKCVFTKDGGSIICAVPKSAPDIVWPDDYYKHLYSTEEQIWSINPAIEKKDLLYEFDDSISIDATDLALSPQEDRLVFLNKKDDMVYSLRVK